MTRLHHDFETQSELDLTVVGVDKYTAHPSTKVLMASFAIDDEAIQQWVPAEGEPMPSDLKEGLRDPDVTKIGFNSQFERLVAARQLDYQTEYASWRCSMVMAYMFSFMGGLDKIGEQMKLGFRKATRGRQLVSMFCGPNKPRKNQPFVWRDQHSDPEEWEEFKAYNVDDTASERNIWTDLLPYTMPDWQWDLYALDQIINDRGLPINRQFVENALWIADRRRSELISEQNQITGLANSNSRNQLLPWLTERGYPFEDLQKDNVSKALAAEEEVVQTEIDTGSEEVWNGDIGFPLGATRDNLGRVVGDAVMTQECRDVLRMRQSSAKTSTTKYAATMSALAEDDRLRHCFQFAGASRTNRWSGRLIQPQNLPRTPKWLEPDDRIDFDRLDYCNGLIQSGEYEALGLFAGDQMDGVSACVRSAIQAPEGKKLVVCDLSSIESVVIGWLTGCERLLNVFREGRDAYKDFATYLYGVSYDEVTKAMRTISKPAVLGAGFRLGGGQMYDGKKSGLWAYAESMGVIMTQEEANKAVAVFRETYREIPEAWYDIESAIERAMKAGGRPIKWNGLVFEVKKPFLRVILPSGRPIYYYKLQCHREEAISRAGNPYQKLIITYMGKDQHTNQWTRIESHGGKFIENFVQAIARDLLAMGMVIAHEHGFYLIGHVHDELISEEDEDDEYHSEPLLRECITKKVQERYPWTAGLPLGAAGYEAKVYRKD